jgi:YD repeat-containing protein
LAGEERYDYDPLGRLIRVVDEQGRVTEYEYDAAGNILAVRVAGEVVPPTTESSDLGSQRRGEKRPYRITGFGLSGAMISSPSSQVALSGVRITNTQVDFTVTVMGGAPLGALQLSVSNARGTLALRLEIEPAALFSIQPTLVVIPPDNIARQVGVVVDPFEVSIALQITSTDATVFSVDTPDVTLNPGQTQALVRITGKSSGIAELIISSPQLLDAAREQIVVTPEYLSFAQQYSPIVGIARGSPVVSDEADAAYGAAVGIAKGAAVVGSPP